MSALEADIPRYCVSAEGPSQICPGAETPSRILRKGAHEALRGQSVFGRDISTIRTRGAGIPLKMNEMGHYVLSVVAFGKGPSRVDRRPNLAAPVSGWTVSDKRPDVSNGGLHLPSFRKTG